MVLNYIWIVFFLVAFVVAMVKLVCFGDVEVFPAIMNSTFDTSKTAFEISLGLTGVLSLWLGGCRRYSQSCFPTDRKGIPSMATSL